MGKVYLVTMKNLMETYLVGVYSSREKAEEQKSRVERYLNRADVFTLTKMDAIIEADLDSTSTVYEIIGEIKKELAE